MWSPALAYSPAYLYGPGINQVGRTIIVGMVDSFKDINKLKEVNQKYNVIVPWYIMTSSENNDEIIEFFKEHNNFNYPSDYIKFFVQEDIPLLTENKKFIVADASQYLKNTDIQYDFILLDVYSNSFQVPEGFITAEFMARLKSRVAANGIIAINMIVSPSFNDQYSSVFDNTFNSVFTHNTSRQVIDGFSPWKTKDNATNVLYFYYNIDNDGRIYTINKTPVIYDRLM